MNEKLILSLLVMSVGFFSYILGFRNGMKNSLEIATQILAETAQHFKISLKE